MYVCVYICMCVCGEVPSAGVVPETVELCRDSNPAEPATPLCEIVLADIDVDIDGEGCLLLLAFLRKADSNSMSRPSSSVASL